MAEDLAASESEDTRRWALTWLSERGHGKTPDRLELAPGAPADDADETLDHLSVDQLRELAELERRREAILGCDTGVTPERVLAESSTVIDV